MIGNKMKFDNAFLTASKKVGMQFRNKGDLISVYKDKNDKLHISEQASEEQQAKAVAAYNRLEKYYV